MKKFQSKKLLAALGLVAVMSAPEVALAAGSASVTGATNSADFTGAKQQVQGWALGDLGIAASTVGGLFGLFNAIAGNIKMAATGMGIAFLGAFSPSIIENIYSAVI